MQTITMYLRADDVNAKNVDSYNQINNVLPALTRGMRAILVLKLLNSEGDGIENLENYTNWEFVIADDWNTNTPPQIRVNSGITTTGNEIHISLTDTNTEELITSLGSAESKNFGCELVGFEVGETAPSFLIQFNMQIRNRRSDAGTGTPTPVGDGSYSANQINALFAAGLEVEFSTDNETWSDEQSQENRFYRFRNSAIGHDWSDSLPLIIGPRGEAATIQVGTVTTLEPNSSVVINNSGTENDAIFDFFIPQGEKGDAATIRVGHVYTVQPNIDANVYNAGNENNAILNFSIPQGEKGDKGENSFLYVAYAEQTNGQGFSLTPASALKYRAEIVSPIKIENPNLSHFTNAVWQKYVVDNTIYGDILVADNEKSVTQVNRIVFENATIREGIDGEVIVNFRRADFVMNSELSNYSTLNGRTKLSPWTNGGGSPSGDIGKNIINIYNLPQFFVIENYSTLKG